MLVARIWWLLLASHRQRPGMLLNILHFTGQPPITKNYLVQNVSGAEVEKPCFGIEILFYFILFIYFWLPWVFIAAGGLSLVAVSRGYSLLRCAGFSLQWLLLLWSTGSRRVSSVVVAHGLSCSAACGIFPDQGSNPVPCTGRRIPNHCATRKVPGIEFLIFREITATFTSPRTNACMHTQRLCT